MKFLVTTTPRRLQVPPLALIEASKAWINARLADKTMDCCYGFTTGGGITILNADSAEKVARLLLDYPGYMLSDWKVDALCDINQTLDSVIAMVKRAAG
jgi:cephalosporin-C deacetylase-like acetyl esterase